MRGETEGTMVEPHEHVHEHLQDLGKMLCRTDKLLRKAAESRQRPGGASCRPGGDRVGKRCF